MKRRADPRRLAVLAAVLGIGAIAAAVAAVLGAGAGLWPPMAGVTAVAVCVAISVVAVLDGVLALLLGRRGGGEPRLAALGLVAGAALIATWSVGQAQNARFPDTHDAATSGAAPGFAALSIAPHDAPVEDAGLAPPSLPWPVAETTRRIVALGRAHGWRIVRAEAGHVEATDISSIFGFEDAIAIDIHPAPGGSIVAMRSAARDQRGGDGGRNAARVRGFLNSLTGSVHPRPIG